MMSRKIHKFRKQVIGLGSLLALFCGMQSFTSGSFNLFQQAHAEEHSDSTSGGHSSGGHSSGGHSSGGHSSGGHSSGGQGSGGYKGGGAGGHSTGEHPTDDEHDDEGGDHGQRGPGSGFSGGGQRHVPGVSSGGQGQRDDATRGGSPAWAQEGIPQVELGRLNVARSPDSVVERAFDEVLENWNEVLAAFYSQSAGEAAAVLRSNYDSVIRIDSPLGNLGIYKDLLANNQTQLPDVTPSSVLDMAAIALGSASDKNITVSEKTVKALNIIMGVGGNLTESEVSELADKANNVRAAILEGHGE